MNKLIEKIRQNPILSVAFIVIIVWAARYFLKPITNSVADIISEYTELTIYTKGSVRKFFMLVFSLLGILLVNKGSFRGYGFSKPKNIRYFRMLWSSTLIILASMIVAMVIFNIILRSIFPPSVESIGFPDNKSIMEMILTTWIWSSICEEVLTRGWLQGFINPHSNIKFLKLSLPVWISGLFFGAMHLGLRSMMDIWFVSFIVFNTSVVGLLAAYYREKTKSIYVPIFIHFWANVIGSFPLLLGI